jgi:hypothetical protein
MILPTYRHSVSMPEDTARESRDTAVDVVKSVGPSGLELIQSCVDPLRQTFLPRPTKGWPCETSGPKPFARSSSLLMDSGDICPPQAPNL